MGIQAFKIDDYLERLKYSGPITPSEDQLEALHRAQYHNIPFENFDILLGRGISLEPATLFNKLVNTARGGYCFELNGLFLMALKAFGFEARTLLARVHTSGTATGRGHQIAIVSIRGRQWITDVGFGGANLRAPIPMELNRPIVQDTWTFRLLDAGHFGIMLQSIDGDRWRDLYSFDLSHVCEADINYGNHFTSTHPSSFFTWARVAALPVDNGVITLFNDTLKRSVAGKESIQKLPVGQPYIDALKDHFGIELDVSYKALPPISESTKG
jgi:N-hydroxyarylamine O-acetyltransferase